MILVSNRRLMSLGVILIGIAFSAIDVVALPAPSPSRPIGTVPSSSPSDEEAAVVNGTVIPLLEFDAILERTKHQLSQEEKVDFTTLDGQVLLYETSNSIINEMIESAIIQQEAAGLKISVSAGEVEHDYQLLKSQFPSEAEFLKTIHQNHVAEPDLQKRISDSLLIEKIKIHLSGDIVIDDNAEKIFYSDHYYLFHRPKSLRVRRLVAASERLAEDIKIFLLSEKNFDLVSSAFSGVDSGGIISNTVEHLQSGTFDARIETALFNLPIGDISPIFKTAEGYNIVQVLEQTPEEHVSLKDAKPNIREHLIAQERDEQFSQWLEHAKQKARISINNRIFPTFVSDPLSLPGRAPIKGIDVSPQNDHTS